MIGRYWVTSGPALPCGARRLPPELMGPSNPGTIWLDVCILGTHLPQMYKESEVRELTVENCSRLGICPDCCGFGDLSNEEVTGIIQATRSVDELTQPCSNCGGSGRPAIRMTVKRNSGGITAYLNPIPHKYIPPLDGTDTKMLTLFGAPPDMCLGCGMPQGEALHDEPKEHKKAQSS